MLNRPLFSTIAGQAKKSSPDRTEHRHDDFFTPLRRQDRNVPTLRVVMQHLIDSFKESEALFDA